jgi:hypothetical protein
VHTVLRNILTVPQHRIDEDGDGDSLTTGWCHQATGAQGRGKYPGHDIIKQCLFLDTNIIVRTNAKLERSWWYSRRKERPRSRRDREKWKSGPGVDTRK